MDNDEFDDTLDEDMILALSQAADTAAAAAAAATALPRGVSRIQAATDSGNSARAQLQPRPRAFGAPHSTAANNRSRMRPLETSDSDDAFQSAAERPSLVPSRALQRQPSQTQNLRQTTLWGSTLREGQRPPPSQPPNSRPFRSDLPPEAPTHHELNHAELATWVYPLNLGPIRDYQFSIVKNGLFNNTLVALPTGLGKTFIAATVMLNYYRWTKRAKIVFVAPTKPLAAQQVQACLNVAGIPRSQATLLTGETPPGLREGEWLNKRLFFMTPQTLINDLSKGYAEPKSIVLLVIDEAHRATGDYAYVKVVEFIRRFSKSFRVLALTATPGSTVEGVQDVIDNLGISHVEIRTEESIDIRQYVHSRSIDTVTFDPSDEMLEVRDLFSKALKPLVDKLSAQNIYYGRDPMSLTTYGLLKSRQEWMAGPGRHVNQGTKFMMMAVFGILQSLAHAIKLLNFHGIKPFYNNLAEFRATEEGKPGQGSKFKRQLLADENFQKMMSMIEGWMKLQEFHGHPKLAYLCEALVNHFVDAGEGSSTRAIVFSEYRDSAEEIVRLLNRQPLIKAHVFVGQADSKRSEGMKQKQQIETIEKFKSGGFNVLVATSIGEEGLDIGQVDLIICYDASSSPIRMLQRMGRTGRKRAGNIVLLLMKGKEKDKFAEAKDNYQRMQQLICNGDGFTFRHDLSTRIIPRDIRPDVEKRLVDIPIENSQDPSLPEPKKTAAGLRKKPAKKRFHMPDGVETGFMKASSLGRPAGQAKQVAKASKKPVETDFIVDIPELDKVLLSKSQTDIFQRVYKSLPLRSYDRFEHIEDLRLDAYPAMQRVLRPTVHIKHGDYTKRCVRLLKVLGNSQERSQRQARPYGTRDTSSWRTLPVKPFADDSDAETVKQQKSRHTSNYKKASRYGRAAPAFVDDCEEEDEEGDEEDDTTDTERTPRLPRDRGRGPRNKGPSKRVRDELEDVGDDCTRTSDMLEPEDSDSGADLADFVVGDDEVVFVSSAQQQRSTDPMTPQSSGLSIRHLIPARKAGESGQAVKDKPFFEPMQFGPTQDSDDEMPDLVDLARSVSAKKKRDLDRGRSATISLDDDDDDGDSDDSVSLSRPAAKRRRQVLANSDDDDE